MLGIFDKWWNADSPRHHVLGFYDAMEPFHKANCRRWFMNLNMLVGNQYAAYDNDKAFTMSVPRAPTWRKRAQFNKLLPLAILQKKQILPVNANISTRPANADSDEDKAKAKLAQRWLRAKWKEQEFQRPLGKTAGRMVNYGVGYLSAVWDGTAGVELAPGVGTGDLVLVSDSPFEMVPDYSVDEFDIMPRYVRVKVRSVEFLKHKYGVDVKPEKLDIASMFQLRAQALATKGAVDIGKALENHATVYEMWELPSTKYPDGFHFICTRENDLSRPETINLDPYYELTEINGVETKKYFLPPEAARLIPLEDVLVTTCSVEMATGKQCFYNEGKSEIKENTTRTGRTKVFIAKNSIADGSFIEDPAEVKVEFDPEAGPPPIPYKPPEMANYHLEAIRSMVPEMEDDFGIHQATQGVLPRRATSGKAIGFLIGQDEERHSDPRAELDNAVTRVMRKALNIMANAATEDRVADLIGEDGQTTVRQKLSMKEFRAVDVTLTRDVSLPTSAAARWDLAVEILDKKPTPEQLRIMFAIMRATDIEDLEAILTGNSQAEELYALMENHDFRKMIPRPVAPFENHVMHEKTHQVLLSDPKTPEAVKMMVMQHINDHRAQGGLESAQKEAEMQAAGPGDEGAIEESAGELPPPVQAAAPQEAAAGPGMPPPGGAGA